MTSVDLQIHKIISSYHAYGMSNIDILEGNVPLSIPEPKFESEHLSISSSETLLTVKDVGKFYAKNGSSIIYEKGQHINSLCDYLTSYMCGQILRQRGHLLLHANTCLYKNQAIAFCGDSAAGKSTLAAYYHNKGALFHSDEIACFDLQSNQLLPGFPFLRLWKNCIDKFKFPQDKLSPLWDGEAKYSLCTKDQRLNEPMELNKLIFIEVDEKIQKPTLIQMKGLDKLKTFWNSYYRPNLIQTLDLHSSYQKQTMDILKTLDVYKLKRPSEKDSLSECTAMLNDLFD